MAQAIQTAEIIHYSAALDLAHGLFDLHMIRSAPNARAAGAIPLMRTSVRDHAPSKNRSIPSTPN
ncbi:hypothetical protein [Mesorhizobium sp. LjRoot246]|uniref:hypothetical protein n=1 Tax=Mesorhizobium sp. LjRoot246 TaxID=3342294 RepID=UPI003ECEBD78